METNIDTPDRQISPEDMPRLYEIKPGDYDWEEPEEL